MNAYLIFLEKLIAFFKKHRTVTFSLCSKISKRTLSLYKPISTPLQNNSFIRHKDSLTTRIGELVQIERKLDTYCSKNNNNKYEEASTQQEYIQEP